MKLPARGRFQLRPHPPKDRPKEAHIAEDFRNDPVDPEEVAQAVFEVMARHVTPGEIEGVKRSLPSEIRSLWEEEAHSVWM
jgi:uncharacterized protein (DUF2267 family)